MEAAMRMLLLAVVWHCLAWTAKGHNGQLEVLPGAGPERQLMQTDGIASPADAASPAVRPHEPLPVVPPSHQGATSDPVTPTPNPTVVRSAEELQAATLAGALNIEIHDHIDLRGLSLAVNPDISGPDIHTFIKRLALMYATAHTRSIRGNCGNPDAAASLRLDADLAADLLPMKPRQCLLVMNQTWLMVNADNILVDNLYLKLSRTLYMPTFVFITQGALFGEEEWFNIKSSSVYVINVTFHAEDRGCAAAVSSHHSFNAVYLDDCIFTNWAGYISPVTMLYQSVANIRNTLFRNMLLAVELVDVSNSGTARFENVLLSNVTLRRGAVVSTTFNDYQPVFGYHTRYYAADDENYDVEVVPVPMDERDAFGEDFRIDYDIISDCIGILLDTESQGVDLPVPGCPEGVMLSVEGVRARGVASGVPPVSGMFDPVLPEYADPEYIQSYEDYESNRALQDINTRFAQLLLTLDDLWLVGTLEALPPLSPAPGWPEVLPRAPPETFVRKSLLPDMTEASLAFDQHRVGTIHSTSPANTALHAVERPRESVSAGALAVALLVVCAVILAAGALCWRRTVKAHQVPCMSKTAQPNGRSACDSSAGVHMKESSEGDYPPSQVCPPRQSQPGASSTRNTRLLHSSTLQHVTDDPVNLRCAEASSPIRKRTQARSLPLSREKHSDGSLTPAISLFSHSQTIDPSTREPGQTVVLSPYTISSTGSPDAAEAGSAHAAPPFAASTAPTFVCTATESSEPGNTIVLAPYTVNRGPLHADTTGDSNDSDMPLQNPSNGAACSGASAGLSNPLHGESLTLALNALPVSPPGSDLAQGSSMPGERVVTAGEAPSAGGTVQHGCVGVMHEVHAAGPVYPVTQGAMETASSAGDDEVLRLNQQLNAFGKGDLFLGRFEMLGPMHRRRGGQAVVQFAREHYGRCEHAVKFFLDRDAFLTEAALYAACAPRADDTDLLTAKARSGDTAAAHSLATEATSVGAVSNFLPQVEAVCDGLADGGIDTQGRQLPPCIVMEKGESLQDWSDRGESDLYTTLAVLANVSRRMADMHEAGYVHRDLKPANVMWLPRQNRWTVIDFGCVARIGQAAPVSFTLTYAPPEVALAWRDGRQGIQATAAMDSWSFGVMAFEMLTCAPAFDLIKFGRCKVVAMLVGDDTLPWEGDLHAQVRGRLGPFKKAVLRLLQRDPAQRGSMESFHAACGKLFCAAS